MTDGMVMIVKYALSILLLLNVAVLAGQSKKQWSRYGAQAFAEKDYQGAALYYDMARQRDTADIHVLHSYCQSLRLANNYPLAESYYRQLIALDTGGRYPQALFYLGVLQKNNQRYEEARDNLNLYASGSGIPETERQRIANEIAGCEIATRDPEISAVNAEETRALNSPFADFAQVFVNDSLMLFSSQRADQDDYEGVYPVRIYQASLRHDGWRVDGEFAPAINSAGVHVSNGAFSPDGQKFYFSACDRAFSCQIMVSRYEEEKWSAPVPLDETINYPGYSTTQPFATRIGERDVLLYVSDRPGGRGKLDIWYASRKEGDSYYEPVNLGSTVNSPEDDVTPWYDPVDSVLYFSSSWWPGLGGFDLFRSKGALLRQGPALNLGKPYNSPANDLYFSLAPDRRWAYLSSNRFGTSGGDTLAWFNDIWRIRQPVGLPVAEDGVDRMISASEQIAELNEELPLCLYFHNDQPRAGNADTISSVDYLQAAREYLEYKSLYLSVADQWDGSAARKNKNKEDIQFFFDERVAGGLDRLDRFMGKLYSALSGGYSVRLGARAYVSPLGGGEYNRKLARRRIESFIKYAGTYNDGCLLPFLSDGALVIEELPGLLAEPARNGGTDLSRAVYGHEAAEARRIEIAWVLPVMKNDIAYAHTRIGEIRIPDAETGRIGYVEFQNLGNREFLIEKVEGASGVVIESFSSSTAPGGWGRIYFTRDKHRQEHSSGIIYLLDNDLRPKRSIEIIWKK